MSTTVLKKQGKVEASDLYELAKKGIITHTGLFEVEGKTRELKGLRGSNKEKLEDSEYLLSHGLVTVTFGKEVKSESGKEQGKSEKPEKESGKNQVENKENEGKEESKESKEENPKPSVIKEEEGSEEGVPLSEKPEESSEKESKGSEE